MLENQYRATLAQILGGVAVAIGIYFAWENFKTLREGQITDRFSRAVEQLGANDKSGNPVMEIRLGGIYALEGISQESNEYYWPIMEIFTAYVRKNSSSINKPLTKNKVSEDIQAILTVIGRRKYSYKDGKLIRLDMHETYLKSANLRRANLKGIIFSGSILESVSFDDADLENANFNAAKFDFAYFKGASFKGAFFGGADLRTAKDLSFDQLSIAKKLPLYLDDSLKEQLMAKHRQLFVKPDPNELELNEVVLSWETIISISPYISE